MLASKLPAGVHQGNCVEGAAAIPRMCGRVSGSAMEKVLNGDEPAQITLASRVAGRELIPHVRAKDQVHVLEQSSTDVERFRAEEFLSDAGNNSNGAAEMMLVHEFFQDQSGGNVHSHPGIVAFAVSRCAFDERVVIRHPGPLRGARDAVDIRDEGDHRFPAPVRRHPRGRNSCHSAFHLKAIFLEDSRDVARGFKFLKTEFAEAEDLVHHLLCERLQAVHLDESFLLQAWQRGWLLRCNNVGQKYHDQKRDETKCFSHETSRGFGSRGENSAIAVKEED